MAKTVLLIGAARSGTKFLRSLIGANPYIAAIPDDVNYVWRLGLENVPHDEFTPEMLDSRNAVRIRRWISRQARGRPIVLEKTVSNSLRVSYCQAVLPDAPIVFLVRNGLDVVESLQRQWLARPELRYVVSKARRFPLTLAPGYAWRYARDTVRRMSSNSKRPVWGVRYKGIDEDLETLSLIEVCARQWATCVERSIDQLGALDESRILRVRYEDLVRAPDDALTRLGDFLDLELVRPWRESGTEVDPSTVGLGRRRLSDEDVALVTEPMQRAMQKAGYALE